MYKLCAAYEMHKLYYKLHMLIMGIMNHVHGLTTQAGRHFNWAAKFCFLSILVRISSGAHGIKEGEQCLAH